jgi:N-acetyl-gamma-glutamyl-phosphate reductase common form
VQAFQERSPRTVLLDLGADHRFDAEWVYGQPERFRERLRGARRIANPGCYATAAQLAIDPLLGRFDGPVNVFGVSGYSGAGATPSPRNDPEALRDNVMPYALVGHTHERELSAHLGTPVYFMPHVAPFFRGVTVTVSFQLRAPETPSSLWRAYEERWGQEPLVRLSKEAPLVRDVVGKHEVRIGGLSVSEDGRHAVVVATVDNLLGGAATQALRNLNLATGQDELHGIEP